jgi:hypothetical protein
MGVSVGAGRGVPEATGVCELVKAEAARARDVAWALTAYRSWAMELSSEAAAGGVGLVRGEVEPPGTSEPGSDGAGLAAEGGAAGAFAGGRAGVTCWTCAGGPADKAGPAAGESCVAPTAGGGVTASGVAVETGVLPANVLLTI